MRCFTTLLACGWLLFYPPISNDGDKVDFTIPLEQWQHVASFDTASACEGSKTADIEYFKQIDAKSKELKEDTQKPLNVLLARVLKGRCIPTEAIGFKFK